MSTFNLPSSKYYGFIIKTNGNAAENFGAEAGIVKNINLLEGAMRDVQPRYHDMVQGTDYEVFAADTRGEVSDLIQEYDFPYTEAEDLSAINTDLHTESQINVLTTSSIGKSWVSRKYDFANSTNSVQVFMLYLRSMIANLQKEFPNTLRRVSVVLVSVSQGANVQYKYSTLSGNEESIDHLENILNATTGTSARLANTFNYKQQFDLFYARVLSGNKTFINTLKSSLNLSDDDIALIVESESYAYTVFDLYFSAETVDDFLMPGEQFGYDAVSTFDLDLSTFYLRWELVSSQYVVGGRAKVKKFVEFGNMRFELYDAKAAQKRPANSCCFVDCLREYTTRRDIKQAKLLIEINKLADESGYLELTHELVERCSKVLDQRIMITDGTVKDNILEFYIHADKRSSLDKPTIVLYNEKSEDDVRGHITILSGGYNLSLRDELNTTPGKAFLGSDTLNKTRILNTVYYDIESVHDYVKNEQIPVQVQLLIEESSINFDDSVADVNILKKYSGFLTRHNTLVFEGGDCILRSYLCITEMLPGKQIRFIGFNSSKYDVYFYITALQCLDCNMDLLCLRDKLYMTTNRAEFTDILPLVGTPGSLESLCKAYKTKHQKLSGDISFLYMNDLFNHICNRDIDTFIQEMRSRPYVSDASLSAHDVLTNYCAVDVICLMELTAMVRENFETLARATIEAVNPSTVHIDLFKFKTIGQFSKALLCYLSREKGDSEYASSLELCKKGVYYNYQAALNRDTMKSYSELRSALIASVSYSKTKFSDSTNTYQAADIVSMYPYVLQSKHMKYGHGALTRCSDAEIAKYNKNPAKLPLGIYKVFIEFNKERFQRIPYKPVREGKCIGLDHNLPVYELTSTGEEMSYQWVHNECLYRSLYAQDVHNLVKNKETRTIKIISGFKFSEVATGFEMFGEYMRFFCKDKNKQDRLKAAGSADYSAGKRESDKAGMNILSGKLVQQYEYEATNEIKRFMTTLPQESFAPKEFQELGKFTIVREKKPPIDLRVATGDINTPMFYDHALIGGQLYCHSRNLMFDYLIRPCYRLGFEPIIIETDSMLADKRFFDLYLAENPTMLHPTKDDKVIPFFCESGKLKVFGQAEIEISDCRCVKTYMKKSYYLEYYDNNNNKHVKSRFKGVSQKAIIIPKEFIPVYDGISRLETEEARRLLNQKTTGADISDLPKIRRLVHNLSYKISLDARNSMKNEAAVSALFDSLILNEKRMVSQVILKKNIIADRGHECFSVSYNIASKMFNKPPKVKNNKKSTTQISRPKNTDTRSLKEKLESIIKSLSITLADIDTNVEISMV